MEQDKKELLDDAFKDWPTIKPEIPKPIEPAVPPLPEELKIPKIEKKPIPPSDGKGAALNAKTSFWAALFKTQQYKRDYKAIKKLHDTIYKAKVVKCPDCKTYLVDLDTQMFIDEEIKKHKLVIEGMAEKIIKGLESEQSKLENYARSLELQIKEYELKEKAKNDKSI